MEEAGRKGRSVYRIVDRDAGLDAHRVDTYPANPPLDQQLCGAWCQAREVGRALRAAQVTGAISEVSVPSEADEGDYFPRQLDSLLPLQLDQGCRVESEIRLLPTDPRGVEQAAGGDQVLKRKRLDSSPIGREVRRGVDVRSHMLRHLNLTLIETINRDLGEHG